MQIKLLIFEENHFEVLNVYNNIFKLLEDKIELHMATTHEVYFWVDKAKLPYNIFFTDDFKSRVDIKNTIVQYIKEKQVSIFIYNTILIGDYQFAGELMKQVKNETICKIVLTVHNINALFRPLLFHRNILVTYQRLKDYWFKFRYIHPNTDAYNMLCTNQILFLNSINKTSKPVLYIPPCIIEKEQVASFAKQQNELLVIAVPGSVDRNRRDYEFIIRALKLDTSIFPRLKLIILGPFKGKYGKMIYEDLKEMEQQGLTVWFANPVDGNISEEIFAQQAAEAEVFVCPLKEETNYEGNKELYGKSKSSGSFYDIVRYRKAAIFPSNISLPKEVTSCTMSYDSEQELLNILKLLLNDTSILDNLNKEVVELYKYFGAEKLSNTVYQKLYELI